MKAKEVLKSWEKLGKILKQIEKGNFNELDKDAALEKVREIYTHLLNFDEEYSQKNAKEEKDITPKEQTENNQTKNREEKENDIPADMFSNENEQKEEIKEEEVKPEPVAKKEKPVEEAKPKTEAKGKEKPLGERLGENRKAVNERIKEKKSHKDIASKLKSKPISDIRAAIGLGDRFLFIKDLFKGNADEFNKCIDKLNNENNFENAVKILEQYDWEWDNETVQYFLSIVERKYQN